MTDLVFPERPLLDIIKGWLNGDRSKPLLLIGEKDSKKSIFSHCLLQQAQDFHPPGIILLDLHNLTGMHRRLPTSREMIAECVARSFHGEKEFTYSDYYQSVLAGAMVIVDGIERALEQLTHYDGEVMVKEVLNFVRTDLQQPLMITCRPETLDKFPSLGDPTRVYRVGMPTIDLNSVVDKAA